MAHKRPDPSAPPPRPKAREIWCCACNATVHARLTNGAEIYPHRADLLGVPFWKCDGCHGHVGTHNKRKVDPMAPLGVIPTPALRDARQKLHALIDPLWKSGLATRGQIYNRIGLELGRDYHTAELRTLEEAREVWRIVKAIEAELRGGASAREGEPS